MGIRYYAYPVCAELVDHARSDPLMFLSPDPLMDAWGGAGGGWARSHSEPRISQFVLGEVPEEERPRMLYLDKAFGVLQRLLAGRPSELLVSGQVRHHGMGWEPWIRVLDSEDVADIACDIVLVEPVAEGSEALEDWLSWNAEDINNYLGRAQQFVCELADENAGLVYMIG